MMVKSYEAVIDTLTEKSRRDALIIADLHQKLDDINLMME